MKRNLFTLISLCAVMLVLFSGCTDQKAKKAMEDMRVGHAEYVACLKHCDELAAQYRAQYADCKQHCPMLHPALCDHLATLEQRTKCILENSYPDPAGLKRCDDEFSSHMDEVNACRKACLDKYEGYFATEK